MKEQTDFGEDEEDNELSYKKVTQRLQQEGPPFIHEHLVIQYGGGGQSRQDGCALLGSHSLTLF